MNRAAGSGETSLSARDALARLCAGFGVGEDALDAVAFVEPAAMPATYGGLLNHNAHMTTTLKAYHGEAVTLRVVSERQNGEVYSRLIKLCAGNTDHVVEVGVLRFDLSFAHEAVRRAVLDRTAPLGDILEAHEVLRRIEPRWFLRLGDAFPLLTHFGDPKPPAAFARIGQIYCNDHPAIDLLEIVTDQPAQGASQ